MQFKKRGDLISKNVREAMGRGSRDVLTMKLLSEA
jgi:hypothetical protein